MKKWIRLALILALAAITGAASPAPSRPLAPGKPHWVGISAERLARIDEMCQRAVENGDVPGIVALVARRGRIVYHKAFGMAEPETGRKMEQNSIFRIASQSKAITSTAAMMLWEEGKFRLDDPISKWIPEFKNPQVLKTYNEADGSYTTEAARSEITIRQLLNHTSGIGYGVIDGDERFKKIYAQAGVVDLFTTDSTTIGESVKRLARLPLHHHPGERFTYSEGLDVLGYFIEIVSGMKFDQFLRERLFEPLGMQDTWFYLPEPKADRLVPVLTPKEGKWTRLPVTFYDPDYPVKGARTFFSGGAGLSSSARDYATFLQMYINGGELNGTRLLSRTTIATILANQTGDLMGGKAADHYYGLAFGVVTEAGTAAGGKGSPGTFDWGGYFNTQYFADPKEQVIGILMKQTQGTTSDNTGDLFRQLVMQAIDD